MSAVVSEHTLVFSAGDVDTDTADPDVGGEQVLVHLLQRKDI